MSDGEAINNVFAVILVYTVIVSAFTSPMVFAVPAVAGNTGNDAPDGVWPTIHGNDARTGYVATASPPANNPYKAWEAVQNDAIVSSPAVANDTVFVGSETKNQVYALDSTDGAEQWSFTANAPVQSPTLSDGVLYAGTADGNLHALDATDGSVLWSRSLGTSIDSAPSVVNGNIYATAANAGRGSVWALDEDTGSRMWRNTVSGSVGGSPAVADGSVFVSGAGNVHAFDTAAGNTEWSVSLDQSAGLSTPAAGNDAVYVADSDPSAEAGTVYALDTKAGNVQWSQETSTEPVGSPALAHGTVYVAASDSQSNALLRLDENDGTLSVASKSREIRTSPVVAERTVFVGTTEGVLASNTTSGDTRYVHDIPGDGTPIVASAPAVGNQAVYVGVDRANDSVYKLAGDDFDYEPEAKFDPPSEIARDETVRFDGSKSSDFDDSIASYEWDFDDDGNFEKTGRSVGHAFDSVGNQQVTLRVVDDDGLANTATERVTVVEPANLDVTGYTVSETSVGLGDQVTVEATVENTGDVSGSRNVDLYDNGSWADSEYVTVSAHDTTTVTLSTSLDELGNHSVTVESLDATHVEVSDETPPPAPTSVSTDGWDSSLYFIWDEVNDLESGLDHYEVKVEDGNWQNAGTVRTFKAASDRTGKIDGWVRAVDNEGNAGPATKGTFKVDNTPPTEPDISIPNGWVNNDNVWITVQNSTDEHSGFEWYRIDVDSSPWKYPTEPNVTLSLSGLDLATGSHYISVQPRDNEYNDGQFETVEVKVDETEPSVSVETTNGSDTSTLSVEVTDPHSGLDSENVSISVNGESVSEDVSGSGDSVVYSQSVTGGTHYVEVDATDNVSNSVSDVWSVTANESAESDEGDEGGGGGGNSGTGGVRGSSTETSTDIETTTETQTTATTAGGTGTNTDTTTATGEGSATTDTPTTTTANGTRSENGTETSNATTGAPLADATTTDVSETAADSSGSVPGFDTVGAVVALVVATLVARRRR